MAKINQTKGISFPDENLLNAARAKAKAEGRSLSNYICRLIELDLASRQLALHEETSSAKIEEIAQHRKADTTYKIRRQRKPLP